MFPVDQGRNANKFKFKFARHSRLLDSAIPQMQRLLNEDWKNNPPVNGGALVPAPPTTKGLP